MPNWKAASLFVALCVILIGRTRNLFVSPFSPSKTRLHPLRGGLNAKPSSTQLHGVRARLKRWLSFRSKKTPSPSLDDVTAQEEFSPDTVKEDETPSPVHTEKRLKVKLFSDAPQHESTSAEQGQTAVAESQQQPTTAVLSATLPLPDDNHSTTTITNLQQQSTTTTSKTPLYTLPPLSPQATPLEREFRDMLEHFTQYTMTDVMSIRHERLRVLFDGVIASAGDVAVYRAFEVLFEDLYPVRVAGRIIFGQLEKVLAESRREQQEEVAAVVASTGLEVVAVEQARLVFLAIALRLNGDTYLTLPQLLSTGLANTAVETLRFDSAEAFLKRIDTEQKGQLRFADMMLGLHQCAEEICMVEQCNAAETVRVVLMDLVEHPPQVSKSLDAKRERLNKRYDEMVGAFRDWENLVPKEGEDAHKGRRHVRLLDVVRGCFVGAKNPQVVNALRVLYTDYGGLRIAGDLIFKLTSSLMEGRKRRDLAKSNG